MNIHKEIKFEDEICEHLGTNDWLYNDEDATDYDRQLALFPPDVLTWIQETQPDAWETLTKNHGDAAGQTLLNRLRDSLDESGTLASLPY
jgi:type I restriction enzyme R subunit